MKLSEAMMLGAAGWPANDGRTWIDLDSNCGCALGRAWFAVGRTIQEFMNLLLDHPLSSEWPWFLEGQRSFESIVDHVRSIEPDCGECNQFECRCGKAQEESPVAQEQAK